MNKPWRITFTGIDESCPIADLFALLDAGCSRIELGILYSDTRAGAGRYPGASWIRQTARRIHSVYGRGHVALHVCGSAVRRLLRGEALHPDLSVIGGFERIQLNGRFTDEEVGAFRKFVWNLNGGRVITQFDSNPSLHTATGTVYERLCSDGIARHTHQVLFDASGGRGVVREEWPAHLGGWACGYAGGLGPDNLRDELPRIAAAAGAFPYWIDMESKLRDGVDQFSLVLAHRALDAVLAAERERESA
jgi:hypothetical protein